MHRLHSGYHAIARGDNAVQSGILARRIFTLVDQQAFAALSGDWNPLHVDPIAARRALFGGIVVHGVHLALWAIDRWLAAGGADGAVGGDRAGLRIASLRAAFRKPVYVGAEVTLEAEGEAEAEAGAGAAIERGSRVARLRAITADGRALELSLALVADDAGAAAASAPADAWPAPVDPDELSREAAAAARGELPLAIDADRARALFPAACARLGPVAIAELLATTRLVGMRCPGLHSLFGGLSLAAAPPPAGDAPDGAPALRWQVAAAKLAYSALTLRVEGPTLAGTLDTFYRPPPRRLALAEARRATPHAAFAGWRALVVGGSRGLGEAIALAIGAGGGAVCLTYHRGAADAERVVGELHAAGARAAAIDYDVLAPGPLAWPWPEPPSHLFYLAAPTLHSIRKGAPFRAAELELLVRYFVTGLHATAAAAVALGAGSLVVWTPSTTMLDAPAGGAAYCAAKAAMEELCRHLPALLPAPVTVHAPRLGRVDTDQTAGLIGLPPAPALEAALAHLLPLARAESDPAPQV